MRTKLLLTIIIVVAAVVLFLSENVKEALAEKLEALSAVASKDAEHAENHSSDANDESSHAETGHETEGHHAIHKITVTSPTSKDVTLTERYVCQIHSRRHIELRALNEGYLQQVHVREGQDVKKGDLMFTIMPALYQANLDSDLAEAQMAQVEFDNTKRLVDQDIMAAPKLKLAEAQLLKAKAKVERAKVELGFASIKAPFDGIIDRLHEREGSLLEEGAMLTTLSDNDVMWVYFNVREARYLEYQEAIHQSPGHGDLDIELELANHKTFDQKGQIGAIESDFDNETGNIDFRADFPNPDGLLRDGQTGTILIHRVQEGAIVIPQRSVYDILARTYVYVIDENNVVHQREIKIQKNQLDDIYVVGEGLEGNEKIVLEGVRQVRDGEKVEFEFQDPESVLSNLKYHAE